MSDSYVRTYSSKQDVISAAHRRGSNATTFRGAYRFLMANPYSITRKLADLRGVFISLED